MNHPNSSRLARMPALLLASAVGLLVLGSCSRNESKAPQGVERLTVAITSPEVSALLVSADALGLFRQAGLEVTLQLHDVSTAAVDALLSGAADVATTTEFTAAMTSFRAPELRVFASIAQAQRLFIIGRHDRGINRPEDFAGKRIAVTANTQGEYYLGGFLNAHGLIREDVTEVNLPPKPLIEELVAGGIDAAVIWGAYADELERRLGDNASVWQVQSGREYYWVLAAREPVLRGKPEAFRRLVKGLLKADELARDDQAALRALLAERYSIDREFLERTWGQIRLGVSLEQAMLLIMDDEARWMIAVKLVDAQQAPNLLDVIELQPLAELSPRSVSVIH